ncbi:MAG: YkgJ family cysteine cluster protein [Candidatus Omnitrophica bacterium]|nr:YkgJ family cysteine cluster protein [Candidatus Omnitrophota bacterium]
MTDEQMKRTRAHRKFYRHGLRFECQGGGKCCTAGTQEGYVYLTLADRQNIARYLGISLAVFTRKYCRREQGMCYLRRLKPCCQFLDNNRCAIYPVRPIQCETWPFWPDNLTPEAWRRAKRFCPGIGKGRIHSLQEIERLMTLQARLET